MLQFDLQFYEEFTVAWVRTVKFISGAFLWPTGQLVINISQFPSASRLLYVTCLFNANTSGSPIYSFCTSEFKCVTEFYYRSYTSNLVTLQCAVFLTLLAASHYLSATVQDWDSYMCSNRKH